MYLYVYVRAAWTQILSYNDKKTLLFILGSRWLKCWGNIKISNYGGGCVYNVIRILQIESKSKLLFKWKYLSDLPSKNTEVSVEGNYT